jgi:putative DNA primase/helicase
MRDDAGVTAELDALRDATPPILSPGSPLESAREMIRRMYRKPEGQTIHHQQGSFYTWSGTRYVEEAVEETRAKVYGFLDEALRRAESKDPNDPPKLVPFHPNKNKVANVLEALSAASQLPNTVRAPAWLDAAERPNAPDILACTNGLLHLPSRELHPHSPMFFGLNAVDYDYHEAVEPPAAWLRFLDQLWGVDQESIDTLQELFGLLLTADTSHQKAFLIVGPKRSGKGTIARVLTALLGPENVAGPTLGSLSQNFGLAPLIGKPLAIISDARLSGKTDAHTIAERILAITGEDAVTIDRKFRDGWTGYLPTRFVIMTNELPRLSDASGALASRFIVLRLTKSVYGREDPTLTSKLLAELPAILAWAMDGRDRLAKRGHFVQPATAREAVAELEDLASPISAFLRDRCGTGPGHEVECARLYNAWAAWCRDQHRDHPGTLQAFGRDLRAAVPDLSVVQHRGDDKRERHYQGVGLIDLPKAAPAPTHDGPPEDHPVNEEPPWIDNDWSIPAWVQ